MDIIFFIVSFLAFIVALTVHEFCHGFTAYLLGDNTAKDQGRLTFNPLAHIDWFGTVFLPLILILTNAGIVFGWAKPVPVNYYNLRKGRLGIALVSLAGPAANFVTGVIAMIVLKFVLIYAGLGEGNLLVYFLVSLVMVNFVLMIFNLIPIPPLDGSKVLFSLLPPRFANIEVVLERYGMFILIAFLIFGGSILNVIFNWFLGIMERFL